MQLELGEVKKEVAEVKTELGIVRQEVGELRQEMTGRLDTLIAVIRSHFQEP